MTDVEPSDANTGADTADRPSAVGFLVRFAILTVASFTGLSLVTDETLRPYLLFLASICGEALDLMGLDVVRHGTVIALNDFRVDVTGQCSALYETALLVAAILASSASLAHRALGVLAGTAVLFVLNLVRIASLVLIGAFAPQWFDHAHLFVWQALLVAAVAACWLAWLGEARAAAAS